MTWIPALTFLVLGPFKAITLLSPSYFWALAAMIPVGMIGGFYVAPSYALGQSLAEPQSRATASALLMFSINLIGAGLGPTLTGILSDTFAAFMDSAEALQYALLSLLALYFLAAFHYYLASRSLRADIDEAVSMATETDK